MAHKSAIIFLLYFAVIYSECNTLPSQHLSRTKRHQNEDSSTNGSCLVPTIENGKFEVISHNYKRGDPIPNFAILEITCKPEYMLYPNNSNIHCIKGNLSPVPECKMTCQPLISTSVDVECSINNNTVDCTKRLVEGTVARSKCKPFYESTDLTQFPTSTCKAGSWDYPLIHCVPECGEVVPKGVTKIINGSASKKGEFPWHVAIYRLIDKKHEYQCGGSIVTPLVVLTVAHCFSTEYGNTYPAEEYYIGAGKYYSAYHAPEDKLSQIREVQEYHIAPLYRGYETNFQADLAVVVVKTQFQISNVVRPVCMDWKNEFEKQQLKPDSSGSVVGWGYVDSNSSQPSEDLKKLTVPFIDKATCLKVVPKDFTRYVTLDKFCAGYTNGSSVCNGDGGNGLVFPWIVNNKAKYYLRGLVSVGPIKDGLCDNYVYGVYTRVSEYADFILNVIKDNPV